MKRILVVNDSEELLELFQMLLTEEGYEVVMYSTAIEDLPEIERQKPDLIILDVRLGNQKAAGWDMLEKLKLNPSSASIPILMCTAAINAVREQQGYLTSQGVLVVFKPFDIDHLLNAIQKAMQLTAESSSFSKD